MRLRKVLGTAVVVCVLGVSLASAQFWTPLNNLPGANVGVMIQLRDGRILVHEEQSGNSQNWHILTPDSTGSYINGTWSSGGTLPAGYSPWYFSSQVLFGSGKNVLVEGGEYNLGNAVWTTLGALATCKPFGACTWVSNAPPSGWTNIGDAQSVILSNGKYLQAGCCSAQTAEFKAKNTWVLSTNTTNYNDEQGFTLLPSGKVLMVDAWQNPACGNSTMATELRSVDTVSTMGTWSCGPNTTAQLWDSSGHELGPVVLTYDRVNNAIAFGATNNTSIYHISSNSFTVGPTPPSGLTAYDAPASLEPNGKVLAMLGPSGFGAGCQFVEYKPATNTMATTANPTDCPADPSFVGHLMILPTGQNMFTDFSGLVEIYTPASGNISGTAPIITSYPSTVTHGVTNYVLRGKQLNGLTQNNAYGDDYQGDTNYPLIYVTNGNQVYWFFTHNDTTHSIAKGVAMTTHFDVPSTVPPGNYTLYVVANGVKSTGVAITVT
jgi:hypothetical protein